MADVATRVAELADAVTQVAIGVLTLMAALVVLIGVANAVRSRRHEQVVIADIEPLTVAGTDRQAPTASLSPWLRQRVRAALFAQRHDARHIVDGVLGRDVALGRVPVDLTMNHAEAAISGAAEDALATMAQGLRVIAPQQAEGLLGAMSAALPRRRGYRVRVSPLTRGADRRPRLGLALELSHLDGPAIATTTFWEPPAGPPVTPPSAPPTAEQPATRSAEPEQVQQGQEEQEEQVQERMVALIEPAARWIALHLLTLRLVIRPTRRWPWRTPTTVRLGLRRLFAGGLGRTAMEDFPPYAIAFGEDAVAELTLAAEGLNGYHRPWEILAGVREQLARVHQREGRPEEARRQFGRAVREWRQAENALAANPGRVVAVPALRNPAARDLTGADHSPAGSDNGVPAELADDRERLRVRRLKCLLLAGGSAAAKTVTAELAAAGVSPAASMRTLYNAACLYATLGGEHLALAEVTIGRAVLADPHRDVTAVALRDEELRPISGLRGYLDRLAALRPEPPRPVGGDEALDLITRARAVAGPVPEQAGPVGTGPVRS
ncbi:hypothetical protein O7627_21635 [Solwaraspora sp. WMMD1047]|uniref:hypothetical protein n=1 Tax=Solwaraspora sp. WMMD1047 TaxID=3016102 RepID=UPI0024168F99|nr:hypothetical protein [Solwaraspora sp. WMMD1047]MDG4831887.1 hypothetical protein [Solwaraspora sp. WMMD1047]